MAHALTFRPEARRAGRTVPPAIGPNAVTQLAAALERACLSEGTVPIFARAGVTEWLAEPPRTMVDAARAGRLHRTLRSTLTPGVASAVLAEAGRLTADYLLAARIPRPAQLLLKALPASLSAKLLVPAIRAHAWTFAGSGRFAGRAGRPTTFELTGNPLCAGEVASSPVCAWHAAVFQRLFEALVSPDSRAVETACEACGDTCCRFVLDWQPQRPTA